MEDKELYTEEKLIKGIFISKMDGTFLFSIKFDESFDECLLSSFIGALHMFGIESIGKIEEISIKGLDVEVLIVNKYDLILTAILSSKLKKVGLRAEAERALEAFYEKFQSILESWDSNIERFEAFEKEMKKQINEYLESVKSNINKPNKSFWGIFMRKLK